MQQWVKNVSILRNYSQSGCANITYRLESKTYNFQWKFRWIRSENSKHYESWSLPLWEHLGMRRNPLQTHLLRLNHGPCFLTLKFQIRSQSTWRTLFSRGLSLVRIVVLVLVIIKIGLHRCLIFAEILKNFTFFSFDMHICNLQRERCVCRHHHH